MTPQKQLELLNYNENLLKDNFNNETSKYRSIFDFNIIDDDKKMNGVYYHGLSLFAKKTPFSYIVHVYYIGLELNTIFGHVLKSNLCSLCRTKRYDTL